MQLIATALAWENLWLFMPKDPESDPVLQVHVLASPISCQLPATDAVITDATFCRMGLAS